MAVCTCAQERAFLIALWLGGWAPVGIRDNGNSRTVAQQLSTAKDGKISNWRWELLEAWSAFGFYKLHTNWEHIFMLWSCEKLSCLHSRLMSICPELAICLKYYIREMQTPERPLVYHQYISRHFSSCFWVILPLPLCLSSFFFPSLFKQELILPLVELWLFYTDW